MEEKKAGELNGCVDLYRAMIRIRRFEEAVAQSIEGGEVHCPCHLYIGQEAIAAGVCDVLTIDDTVWGGHRSHGHYLAKGGDMRGMMAEIYGKRDGCSRGRGGSMHLFAPEVGILGTVPLVAATVPIAVGAALGYRLRGESKVAVCFFGDGATEEGHFHESLNLAALHRLGVLFVCENNFYSSHLSLLERRAMDNIHDSGTVHAVAAFSLDGNDVLAVRQAAGEARERARAGNGPTLLECRTYRWRGHVGASWDMDVGVQRKAELSEWIQRDPIARLREHLVGNGIDSRIFDAIDDDVAGEVRDAVEFARKSQFPEVDELHDHVFAARGLA